jgi:RNA polymerase sigma-70 factor (ECF subfamily)
VRYGETPDPDALKRLLSEDVRFSMPPEPGLWVGRDAVVESWIAGGFGSPAFGHLRCLHARANRQPALANYVRRAGDDTYRAMALDVLAIDHGALREVITFGPKTFPAFGLPPVL